MNASDDQNLEKFKQAFPDIYQYYLDCSEFHNRIIRCMNSEDLEYAVDLNEAYNASSSAFNEAAHREAERIEKVQVYRRVKDNFDGAIYFWNQEIDIHMTRLVAESNKQVIKASKSGLINQLSIFSIVLSIFTFILNNAKLYAMDGANFYTIMAGNISFILMATVMFSLIYIFLHLDDHRRNIGKTLCRYLVMVGVIVLLCFLTFKLTERADTSITYAENTYISEIIPPITLAPTPEVTKTPAPSLTVDNDN